MHIQIEKNIEWIADFSNSVTSYCSQHHETSVELKTKIHEWLVENINQLSHRSWTCDEIDETITNELRGSIEVLEIEDSIKSRDVVRNIQHNLSSDSAVDPLLALARIDLFEALEIKQEIIDEFQSTFWFRKFSNLEFNIQDNLLGAPDYIQYRENHTYYTALKFFLAFYRKGLNPFFLIQITNNRTMYSGSIYSPKSWSPRTNFIPEILNHAVEYPKMLRKATLNIDNGLLFSSFNGSGKNGPSSLYVKGIARSVTPVDLGPNDFPSIQIQYDEILEKTGDEELSALFAVIRLSARSFSSIWKATKPLGYTVPSIAEFVKQYPLASFYVFQVAINNELHISDLYEIYRGYGNGNLSGSNIDEILDKIKKSGLSIKGYFEVQSSWIDSWIDSQEN